jgi:hypothetical protein
LLATAAGCGVKRSESISTTSYVFTWLPTANRTELSSPPTKWPLITDPFFRVSVSALSTPARESMERPMRIFIF